jgi:hypothetical protein
MGGDLSADGDFAKVGFFTLNSESGESKFDGILGCLTIFIAEA